MKKFDAKLNQLRKKIDHIDQLLLKTFAKRLAISKKIGILKAEYQLQALQKSRWKTVLKTRLATAKELKLRKKFIQELLSLMHKESLSVQSPLINKKMADNRRDVE